jgi:hypothetical protein
MDGGAGTDEAVTNALYSNRGQNCVALDYYEKALGEISKHNQACLCGRHPPYRHSEISEYLTPEKQRFVKGWQT